MRDNQRVVAEVQELFARYSPEQLNWKPDPKTWSIVECLNHLSVTMSLYYSVLKDAIEGLRLRKQIRRRPFRPTWFGKMFIRFVSPQSPRKLKTVRVFEPEVGDLSVADVKALFLDMAEKYEALIRMADGYDLNGKKISSPASRWVRFTPGEALWLLGVHNLRHLQQAQNLTRHPQFPPAKL